MPKYEFSWESFDNETVRILAESCGFDHNDGDALEFLTDLYTRPDRGFIEEVFHELLTTPWLKDLGRLGDIVSELKRKRIGPRGFEPRSQDGYLKFLRDCKPNNETVQGMLCESMVNYGRAPTGDMFDCSDGPMLDFSNLQPERTKFDERVVHEYQQIACDALSRRLRRSQDDGFCGLLVMPTGAGKTFTAVRWLIESVVNKGRKLLWVAHRYELLDQAAREFRRLANLMTPRGRPYRMRVVSGKHSPTTAIDHDDDILVCSINALARNRTKVEEVLTEHFVVIDEAHHAPAKSYRDLIDRIRTYGSQHVLGLTATPTRTAAEERPELARLFGKTPIHQVTMKELIEKRFLAVPVPIRQETNAEMERGVTLKDAEHLRKYHELSPEWKARIAKLEGRNQQIVEHYLQKKDEYKKTLIFAVNVRHAHLLCDAFRNKRVNAACITSYGYDDDGRPSPNDLKKQREILTSFKDPNSGLNVLINVAILTEGVDLPGIQTVFLARPTQSEILLRQMIGRAMRGPNVKGGTEKAFIVSFEDHWEQFREFESPFSHLPDFADLPPIGSPPTSPPPVGDDITKLSYVATIRFDLIRKVAAEIRSLKMQPLDMFRAIPHGWYVLDIEGEAADDVDAFMPIIRVNEHQKPSWDKALDFLGNTDIKDCDRAKVKELIGEVNQSVFADCAHPRPSMHDIGLMVEHFRGGGQRPEYHEIADRKEHDPSEIAERVHSNQVPMVTAVTTAYQSDLIKAIYVCVRRTPFLTSVV